jgi:hypothetical protein
VSSGYPCKQRFRALVFAVAAFWSAMGISGAYDPPLKVGVGRVFPISYRDADGNYAGFAVDVLNEAARREGIRIEWRSTNGSKDAEGALSSGRIDLIPAGLITAERQNYFYVSAPWWSLESTVVSRVDHRTLKRLGINPIFKEMVAKALPNAVLVPYPAGTDRSIAGVCQGDVDATLIAGGELPDILLNRPQECMGAHLTSDLGPVALQL